MRDVLCRVVVVDYSQAAAASPGHGEGSGKWKGVWGKVKRINNAIIVQCQNEILFNEASLKICQKSRAHQSGPVPCRGGCFVGAGTGQKPKAVSRYALISISRIIRHRLRLHLARGHNHYHHHNHHHHRSSLLSLSSVYMGHHRWNRCIKYFVCSDGKLHWNTNLQIQIDVALCQRSGHSDQSSPRHRPREASRLGWAGQGIGHYKGFTRVG